MANKLPSTGEDFLLRINADDMSELGVSDGQEARLASPYGEITVTCHKADVPRGVFFLPLEPLANLLFRGPIPKEPAYRTGNDNLSLSRPWNQPLAKSIRGARERGERRDKKEARSEIKRGE